MYFIMKEHNLTSVLEILPSVANVDEVLSSVTGVDDSGTLADVVISSLSEWFPGVIAGESVDDNKN